MNTEEQQTFKGGQTLVAADEATYLGKTSNRRANAAQARGGQTDSTSKHHNVETESILEGIGS